MMDDEAAEAQKVIHKNIAHIVISAIPMFMLIWTIYSGFKFATKSNRDAQYNHFAFSIGIFTIALGLIYVIMGLAIVVDLALNLTVRLQRQEEEKNCIHQALTQMDIGTARGMKTIHKDIARILATVISMFLLLWTIYTGFRLATEPNPDGKYNQLAFSIGVLTIAFGFIYFVIGIAIVADLASNLLRRLHQQQKKKEIGNYFFSSKDDNYFV